MSSSGGGGGNNFLYSYDLQAIPHVIIIIRGDRENMKTRLDMYHLLPFLLPSWSCTKTSYGQALVYFSIVRWSIHSSRPTLKTVCWSFRMEGNPPFMPMHYSHHSLPFMLLPQYYELPCINSFFWHKRVSQKSSHYYELRRRTTASYNSVPALTQQKFFKANETHRGGERARERERVRESEL